MTSWMRRILFSDDADRDGELTVSVWGVEHRWKGGIMLAKGGTVAGYGGKGLKQNQCSMISVATVG